MKKDETLRRIQFDLTETAYNQYLKLKKRADVTTGAELFRNALKLYSWFVTKNAAGYSVVLRKGDDETVVELMK